MSIVEQIQAVTSTQLPGHLGIELVEATPERVVGRLEVAEHLCTTGHILHGGSIMALADALGATGAFLNLSEGETTSTVESKTNFLRAAKLGATVTATSSLVNKGRTLMLWQTEVRDERDKLIAVVSQSQIVMRPAS